LPDFKKFVVMKKLALLSILFAFSLTVYSQKKEILFNGKDLNNWTVFSKDPGFDKGKLFYIKDGVIETPGKPLGYMRTNKQYSNYQLHVEWRWPENPGNSGILIHVNGADMIWPAHYQGQLKAGDAGDFVLHGVGETVTIRDTVFTSSDKIKPLIRKDKPSSEKKPGEWNSMDVTAKGNSVRIIVNGVVQNIAATCSLTKGAIGLQAEGAKIQFRNIWLKAQKK
jgi:hypothetical protein